MALTVEELQIRLGCDATEAQEVLNKMDATVKAYTEKFQKYFQTKTGKAKPLDDLAKEVDTGVKNIESKMKRLKEAMDFTPKSSKGSGEFVRYGKGPWDKNYFKNSEAFQTTFGKSIANQELLTLGAEAWGRLGEAIEKVGDISAAARMKMSDAVRDVKEKARAYSNNVRDYGSDSKTARKSEEAFKKAIVAADKYTQQLNKVIAKEQEAAQAKAASDAQERAAVIARMAMLQAEERLRQQRIAATTAAIQADTPASRVLGPTGGEMFTALRESASLVFGSIKGRVADTFSFLKAEISESAAIMKGDFAVAGAILSAPFKAAIFAGKGLFSVLKAGTNVVQRIGGAMKKAFQASLLGRFIKRLGTVMMRMAAMALIRGVINGVKKGLEELAKTSESSAKAMNTIKAAGGSIKMALGAAVMPIVKALAPLFVNLAAAISSAANAIARFLAVITGQGTYTAVNFSSALDDVSSSAGGAGKAVKGALAAFDELNVIGNKGGGGGGGSSGVESSLSTVEDLKAFSALATAIRDQIEDGDWEGVGRVIAAKLNEGIKHWNAAEAARSLSDKIKNVLDIAIGFTETFDAFELGAKIREWFENIDWGGIASRVSELFGALFGGLSAFFGGLLFPEGELTLEGFLDGLKNFATNFIPWIKEHIFTPFIEGFKKAFGIHSPAEEMMEPGQMVGQGILEGIAQAFQNIDTIFEGFGDIITASLGIGAEYVRAFFETLIEFISSRGTIISGNVEKFILNLKAGILDGIADMVDRLSEGSIGRLLQLIGVDLGNAAQSLRDKAAAARDSIGEIDEKIADAQDRASSGFNISANVNTSAVETLTKKINDAKTAISNTASTVGTLKDNINGLPTSKTTAITVKVNAAAGTSTNNAAVHVNNPNFNLEVTLANGGLAYGLTPAIIGEYAGARSNPEVVAPLSDLLGILTKANVGSSDSKATEEQNRLLEEQNRLLRVIAQKELKLSPSAALGQVVARSSQLYART